MSARVHRIVFTSLVSLIVFAFAGITAAAAADVTNVGKRGARAMQTVKASQPAKANLLPRLASGATTEMAVPVTKISPRRTVAQVTSNHARTKAKAPRAVVVPRPKALSSRPTLHLRSAGLRALDVTRGRLR